MLEIPKIGFGTYRLKGENAYKNTLNALKNGYRHIDTANLYGNEEEIGKAIKDSEIKREDIWITTKIQTKDILKGKEFMLNSVKNSLLKFDTNYIDLVLLHGPTDNFIEAWEIMEEFVMEEKVKRIGVSNYDISHLEIVLENCKISPYCNQFETNPYCNRKRLMEYCFSKNILPVAHTSLVKGEKFMDPKLENYSKETGISKANLLLAWALNKNMIVLPRSSNIEHISQNFLSTQINLSQTHMEHFSNYHEGYTTHPKYIFQN